MNKKFNKLAISSPHDLLFGQSKTQIKTRRGLVIGNGEVYPELNFTLPPMQINDKEIGRIKQIYHDIMVDACRRALDLEIPGFVVEFETLIEMTLNPIYAIEITKIIYDVMEDYYKKYGLKTVLRITPNDTRDKKRPPQMRSGKLLDKMLQTFEECALNGVELLSIESTGGKEVFDDALMNCDLNKIIFSLAILAVRDMRFLWDHIVAIADKTKTIAAGDTACGFGNTAMILAEKKFIPRIFAALVRVATIPRSLVAYECGAIGPGKDCGYENPFIKAITGYSMSMEGKSSACAHISPLGNIASAYCDLWSNESIQNIKLLGGMAPTVSLEQLIYDCRLMNEARTNKMKLMLRDLFVQSDLHYDPQAFIFLPENIIDIAQAVINEPNYYLMTREAVIKAFQIIKAAYHDHRLKIKESEVSWIHLIETTLEALPESKEHFIEMILPTLDTKKINPVEYGF